MKTLLSTYDKLGLETKNSSASIFALKSWYVFAYARYLMPLNNHSTTGELREVYAESNFAEKKLKRRSPLISYNSCLYRQRSIAVYVGDPMECYELDDVTMLYSFTVHEGITRRSDRPTTRVVM